MDSTLLTVKCEWSLERSYYQVILLCFLHINESHFYANLSHSFIEFLSGSSRYVHFWYVCKMFCKCSNSEIEGFLSLLCLLYCGTSKAFQARQVHSVFNKWFRILDDNTVYESPPFQWCFIVFTSFSLLVSALKFLCIISLIIFHGYRF